MPKKIMPDEEFEEEEEDEEDDYDEEEEEVPTPSPVRVRGRPKKQVAKPPVVKKRYAWVVQQAGEALVDTETNEIIANTAGEALADIKSQLDRIENAIGVM